MLIKTTIKKWTKGTPFPQANAQRLDHTCVAENGAASSFMSCWRECESSHFRKRWEFSTEIEPTHAESAVPPGSALCTPQASAVTRSGTVPRRQREQTHVRRSHTDSQSRAAGRAQRLGSARLSRRRHTHHAPRSPSRRLCSESALVSGGKMEIKIKKVKHRKKAEGLLGTSPEVVSWGGV